MRMSTSTSLAARAVALRGRFSTTPIAPCANRAEKDGVAIEFTEYVDGTAEEAKNTIRRISLSEEDLPFGEVRASHCGPLNRGRPNEGRRLSRDKPKPGGEIAAAREGLHVTYRGEEGSCIEGANARNACQSSSSLISFGLCFELAVENCDPFIERLPAHQHILNREADVRACLPSRLPKKFGDPKSQFSPQRGAGAGLAARSRPATPTSWPLTTSAACHPSCWIPSAA